MPIELLPGESAVDLQYKGLFLLSAQGVAELTTDSVLLADFARAYASEHAVELCSGGEIFVTGDLGEYQVSRVGRGE